MIPWVFDPATILGLVDFLEQNSRWWANRQELEQTITRLAEAGRQQYNDRHLDEDFVLDFIDWAMLASTASPPPSGLSSDPDARDRFLSNMKQGYLLSCNMNAVRFVLQKRYNVMIGKNGTGDRIVFSLVNNAYKLDKHFRAAFDAESDFSLQGTRGIDLKLTKEWLASLGIVSDDVALVDDIPAYIARTLPRSPRGMFIAAGALDNAGHTYVLHEFRTSQNQLEAKVYNPWVGMDNRRPKESQPVVGPDPDWFPVEEFQRSLALPMSPDGEPIVKARDGNKKVYLYPGDDEILSFGTLYYSLLFVPMT